jgi:hypothetical protein
MHRNIAVEYVGNDARPAVQKINPAVLDAQFPGSLLGTSLIEEDEVAPVIEFPNDRAFGKNRRIGQR